MFFAVIPLATSFVIERSQGSLLRLRVLGVSATTLMLSKALPYYFVNLLQMLVMFAVGIWLVPAPGGDRLEPGNSIVGLWLSCSATRDRKRKRLTYIHSRTSRMPSSD